jgi:hypothetical protein
MIGPDKDLFLKGRAAESQGLGIAAFAYYRRIVEGQKNRLLDEVIRVARLLGAKAEIIATLEAAQNETQFSRAVEMVKDVIPPALMIKGHNPFTLLHGAISKDLHTATDEECGENATAIRVVLVNLAERMSDALKDERELTSALSHLLNPGQIPP